MTDSIELHGEIVQKNDELRQVTGWASVVTKGGKPYTDLQGDRVTMKSLRDAVEKFMDDQRVGGYMHQRDGNGEIQKIGKIIGSLIVDADIAQALKMDTDLEGWLITMKVESDEVWDLVKAGEIAGFSIGGIGVRREAA